MQGASGLEAADQAPMRLDQFRSRGRFKRNRLCLLVVVGEDQAPDLVGHRGKQRITLLAGHVTATNQPGEQDLDVDFVIGAVDTGRVVDCVGEDATSIEGKFDPTLSG
jgi:hypothetical protein